jgi:hypothetical protein
LDDALILPHRANPAGSNFREPQVNMTFTAMPNGAVLARFALELEFSFGTYRNFKSKTALDSLIEQNMCQMSQVLGRERTAYHPQARDIAEAVAHQTLQNRLRSVCDAG